jgi:hypothetical protein
VVNHFKGGGTNERKRNVIKTTIDIIIAEKGLPADANVIWSHHVNQWTWIAMGVKPRTVIRTKYGLMVDIYLGAPDPANPAAKAMQSAKNDTPMRLDAQHHHRP